jgi:hypothetical protein
VLGRAVPAPAASGLLLCVGLAFFLLSLATVCQQGLTLVGIEVAVVVSLTPFSLSPGWHRGCCGCHLPVIHSAASVPSQVNIDTLSYIYPLCSTWNNGMFLP